MIHILNIIRCTHQMVQLIKHREESLPHDNRGITARTHFIFMACVFAFDLLGTSYEFGGTPEFAVIRKSELLERLGLVFLFCFVPKNKQNKSILTANFLSTCALISSLAFPQFKAAYYALSFIDAAYRSYRIAKEIKKLI